MNIDAISFYLGFKAGAAFMFIMSIILFGIKIKIKTK